MILRKIALESKHAKVRKYAVDFLAAPAVLATIAAEDKDAEVRQAAARRRSQLTE